MKRLLTPLLIAAVLLVAAPAAATSVVLLDLETHLADSAAVVQAVVGPARSSLDERTGRPVTDTELRVESVLHGQAPEALEVRQLFGLVDGVGLTFPGAGELKEGARVVLFLARGDGRWWLTALAQSVYELSGDGEDALAVRHLDQLHLFRRDPVTGSITPMGPLKESPERAADLKRRIAEAGGR